MRLRATELFFEIAGIIDLPAGTSGPDREYSALAVLLWECLLEELPSYRRIEAFFAEGDSAMWKLLKHTLEQAWPDHPDRRVGDRPMSRSQFGRHRRQLSIFHQYKVSRAVNALMDGACRQAVAMGYMDPTRGSLSEPHIGNIVRGDGQFHNARFDAIEGDKVVDPVTGEVQQARFDPDATYALDDRGLGNPGYRIVHFHVANTQYEQEAILLGFRRTGDGGEPSAARELLTYLKRRLPALSGYLYDMAAQGEFANEMYELDLLPITKLPRNGKGEAANNIIESRTYEVNGRKRTFPFYGLDGVLFVQVPFDGDERLIPMTPKILRRRSYGHVGEYEFPDHAVIPKQLRGTKVYMRMSGKTVAGKNRPQYLRWHNEHTTLGRALLGQRSGAEAQPHSLLERALAFGRFRSVGETRNTLSLIGFNLARNVRAAMAYERRTGAPPGSFPPLLIAA